MFQQNDPLFVCAMEGYEEEQALYKVISDALDSLLEQSEIENKNVVIKPNLVRKMAPELGGTTHPKMLRAVILYLQNKKAKSITIAESPGGLYDVSHLKAIYEGCQIGKVARETGVNLNFDCSYVEVKNPQGEKSKMFNIITPIMEADLIVNLCKLKTHGMMMLSAAAKNFFGVVPGVQKFELHARFTAIPDFAGMLADLNLLLHQNKNIVSICDGIVAMEGNGPTGGKPKKLGVVLASKNPFNIDLAAAKIIQIEEEPALLMEGIRRNYCPSSVSELNIIGEAVEKFVCPRFEMPDSEKSSTLKKLLSLDNGRYARIFEPRPVIKKDVCKGCGECVRSCPEHTIEFVQNKKGKRIAHIKKDKCIKCYCCQELCPFNAVAIHQNPFIAIANKL